MAHKYYIKKDDLQKTVDELRLKLNQIEKTLVRSKGTSKKKKAPHVPKQAVYGDTLFED
jgi:hypothetical protein